MGRTGLSTGLGLQDEELQSYLQTIRRNGSHGKIYQVTGTTSKTPIRADTNSGSLGRKRKGGEAALPTNPKTGHAGKRKTKMQAIQEIGLREGKHACCMALGTIQKSAKYPRNNPLTTPHSCNTMKEKPSPRATKNVVRPSSATTQQKRLTA